MTRRRILVLVAGSLVVVALAMGWQAHQRGVAEDWLRRAALAPHDYTYVGQQEIRWVAGGVEQNHRVLIDHAQPGRTLMVFSDGPLRGTRVDCAGGVTIVDRGAGGVPERMAASVCAQELISADGYRVRVLPGESIAGRPTVLVRLAGAGVQRSLWLDQATALPLQTLTRTHDDGLVAVRYGSFSQVPTPIGTRTPGSDTTASIKPEAERLAAAAGFTMVWPRWAPAGYQAAAVLPFACDCCQSSGVQVRYSDGVTSYSYFVARHGASCRSAAPAEAAEACECAAGASGGLNVVTRPGADPEVVVVGPQTLRVLRRVLASVQ